MIHHTTREFWECYNSLPRHIRKVADKNFSLLKVNYRHPSLQLKQIEDYFCVRVGISYRAVGSEAPDGIVWFWIGSHAEYNKNIKKKFAGK